jgi:hypothetical protein
MHRVNSVVPQLNAIQDQSLLAQHWWFTAFARAGAQLVSSFADAD